MVCPAHWVADKEAASVCADAAHWVADAEAASVCAAAAAARERQEVPLPSKAAGEEGALRVCATRVML